MSASGKVNPVEDAGEFITLARVVKTQGRHGEVAVEVLSDVPDRFVQGMKLHALGPEGGRREIQVEGFWPHKALLVLELAGIDSITAAEALLGCELQVPRAERAELEPGWNYVSDLAGCVVLDGEREIGEVRKVEFGAGEAPLLVVVAAGSKEYEIPFAEAYLKRVDLAARRIEMALPEGMLEVNAPLTEEEKQANRPKKNS
ncbi:MAG TPA: ribosome maturation factor RimM [Terriglobales bacterium]|nr:ribosome maturation factor RimM [Terriglobales bacterium]